MKETYLRYVAQRTSFTAIAGSYHRKRIFESFSSKKVAFPFQQVRTSSNPYCKIYSKLVGDGASTSREIYASPCPTKHIKPFTKPIISPRVLTRPAGTCLLKGSHYVLQTLSRKRKNASKRRYQNHQELHRRPYGLRAEMAERNARRNSLPSPQTVRLYHQGYF